MNIEKGVSQEIIIIADDLFDRICSDELSPVEKLDSFNKLIRLLDKTGEGLQGFCHVSGLLQRSFFRGHIDGYVEGVREYDEINSKIEDLVDNSSQEEFKAEARKVIKENNWRKKMNIEGRQNVASQ